MVQALAEEYALIVFAAVVGTTGTGAPERSGNTISVTWTNVGGVSRRTDLPEPTVVDALERLTRARLIVADSAGDGWHTDFSSLREAAAPPSRLRVVSRRRQAGHLLAVVMAVGCGLGRTPARPRGRPTTIASEPGGVRGLRSRSSRLEQAWGRELRLARPPVAHRRVGIGAGPAGRNPGAVERAQVVDGGAARTCVGALEPAANEIAPTGLVECVGGIEQTMHERVAVSRLEGARRASKIVAARRIRQQRALRRPAAQGRLERGSVPGERVFLDRVRTAGATPSSRSTSSHCGDTQANG
jgi:hypothetical protein